MGNICHHVGIFTNNPRELIRFYTEKLGFEVEGEKTVSEELLRGIFGLLSPCTLTKLRFDKVILEILTPQNLELKKRPNDVKGYNHWSLGVQNKEAFTEELKKKGVLVLEFEKNGHFIYFVKDPEGNLIEIYES